MGPTPDAAAALKSYVYFAEAQDGVYFGGGTEHFLIKGAGIYPLVSRLVSMLDGSRSIEAIRDALPLKAQSFFGVLVNELRDRQMLRECLPSNDNISDEEWRLYRETLLYLRDRTANYASLFRAWRTRTNVIIGGGLCAKALLRGLARTGAGRIHLLYEPGDASAVGPAELVHVLEDHRTRDAAFSYEVLDDTALASARSADARAIYAADHLRPGARTGLHFAGGFLKGQAIVAGGGDADCDAILTDLASRMVESETGAYSAVTAPSIVGNLLAFEILRSDVAAFTDNPLAASAGQGNFLHLSPGGEITTHRLPQIWSRSAPPPAPQDSGFDLFDPLVGIFQRLPALNGHRLPLPHARIRLRLPDGAAAEEIAWGVKQTHAESDVVLQAAVRYAALTQPLSGRMVAAWSRETWMQLALAAAIADSPLFAGADTQAVTLETLDDAEVHFIARIARLYAAAPTITLTSAGGLPAFVATAQVGSYMARAVAAQAIEAICNALGQACSLLQLAETAEQPDPVLVAVRTSFDPEGRAAQNVPSRKCIELLARAGFTAKPILNNDAALLAAGLHVGAIALTPTEAMR